MGPEGPFPLSQALSTCRYPRIKSFQAIPLHSSSFSSNILSSHLSLGLPSGLFPSGLPHQNFLCISPVPHMWHMSLLSHPLFNHPINMWWGAQIMKFLVMEYPPDPCYLFPLKPKYLPRYSCSHLVFIFVVCWTGLTSVRIHLKYYGEFMTAWNRFRFLKLNCYQKYGRLALNL